MKQGFTLIEMIVAVTIMLLLLALTLAGYSNYNDRQQVKQASLTLKSDLRMARTNAVSGKKPTSCADETLVGYVVAFTSSAYTVTPRCTSGLMEDDRVSVSLPSSVTFSPVPTSFTYYPLTQGVSTPPSSIVLTNGVTQLTITIDTQTGEVSQ